PEWTGPRPWWAWPGRNWPDATRCSSRATRRPRRSGSSASTWSWSATCCGRCRNLAGSCGTGGDCCAPAAGWSSSRASGARPPRPAYPPAGSPRSSPRSPAGSAWSHCRTTRPCGAGRWTTSATRSSRGWTDDPGRPGRRYGGGTASREQAGEAVGAAGQRLQLVQRPRGRGGRLRVRRREAALRELVLVQPQHVPAVRGAPQVQIEVLHDQFGTGAHGGPGDVAVVPLQHAPRGAHLLHRVPAVAPEVLGEDVTGFEAHEAEVAHAVARPGRPHGDPGAVVVEQLRRVADLRPARLDEDDLQPAGRTGVSRARGHTAPPSRRCRSRTTC